jgi:hypothetical protein
MGNQLAWATEVPRTVLPAAGRWEHEGTSTVEAAATAGTMGDGPIVVVKDDMAALLRSVDQTVLRWRTSNTTSRWS